MPRLETSTSPRGYLRDIVSLFSPISQHAGSRLALLKSILLRSVRIKISRDESAQLPLRVRPAFIVLNVLDLIALGLLGFHPRAQQYVPINDKILHFIGFLVATGLFYFIWDVDEPARRVWFWRQAALHLSFITCFAFGGLGSEIVQSFLPYKTFQWGDVLANLLGSSLGLFLSYHLELSYRARREIERLYQPLDLEEYDDFDAELQDDEEAGLGRASVERHGNARAERGRTQPKDRERRVRFGDVWDAEDPVPAPPLTAAARDTSNSSSSASSHTHAEAEPPSISSTRAEELFRIDDDEEDDTPTAKGGAVDDDGEQQEAGADVWRDAGEARDTKGGSDKSGSS